MYLRTYTICKYVFFLLQLSCEKFSRTLEATAVTADSKCRVNVIPPLLVTPVPPVSTLLTVIAFAVVDIGADNESPPPSANSSASVVYLYFYYDYYCTQHSKDLIIGTFSCLHFSIQVV